MRTCTGRVRALEYARTASRAESSSSAPLLVLLLQLARAKCVAFAQANIFSLPIMSVFATKYHIIIMPIHMLHCMYLFVMRSILLLKSCKIWKKFTIRRFNTLRKCVGRVH